MSVRTLVLAAFLIAGASNAVHAGQSDKPFLSPLFGDNMVLQRGIKAPIWGWTTPGATVTVRIAGRTATAVADASGKWMARIGPLPAGGPYQLLVVGPQHVTLGNVLVGDVWICSGQSNMQQGIGASANPEAEIAAANHPRIRLFTVQMRPAAAPQASVLRDPGQYLGAWYVCSPATVSAGGWGGFSAVAYYFGRSLQGLLGDVPIGLIHTSWGGTVAEAWTSAAGLAPLRDFDKQILQLRAAAERPLAYRDQLEQWYAENDPGSRPGGGWAQGLMDRRAWPTMKVPGAWETAGLPDYDGTVWFMKAVDLPAAAAGKPARLELGPIDDMDTTYVNGKEVGTTFVYNENRSYAIPAGLLKEGANLIKIRVLDTGGAGGLTGSPEQLRLTVEGEAPLALAGEWQYREGVTLAKAKPVPLRMENNPNVPTVLYNGMIAPLVPFGIKGVIWYQGESNAGRAYQYRELLPALIADWRKAWGQGNFAFLIVQLANFLKPDTEPRDDPWPELREAQYLTTKRVPGTGLAVAIDIGEADDIHPKNKQDVGKRLAWAALPVAYGRQVVGSGPVYRSMRIEGSEIRISFDHVAEGLVVRGEKLMGFAIAGSDRKFVWADARVDGRTVVVSSPQVPRPVAVRYAWSNNPVCNLYNTANLPAVPFRTDNWPGVTAGSR